MTCDDPGIAVARAGLALAKKLVHQASVGLESPALELDSEAFHENIETLYRAQRVSYEEHRANLLPEALRALDAIIKRTESEAVRDDLHRLSDSICADGVAHTEAGYLYGLAIGLRLGGGLR